VDRADIREGRVSRGLLWIAALAPQVLLVAGMVAAEEIARLRGTEVVLEVRAYDPMDLVSGRYVSTPLAIARLDGSALPHPDPMPEVGSTVFVRLAKSDPFWKATEVLCALPEPQNRTGEAFLRAKVDRSWAPQVSKEIHLSFEIDRFYIPEEAEDPSVWRGGDTERRRLSVIARITRSGRAHLVDLLVDGKPYADWNREEKRKAAQPIR
jgi:uncharacterized membrane-anchored protein